MKLSPNTSPLEPADLLIRMHNLVGAAVDVTGRSYGKNSRWTCHGCGATSDYPVSDFLPFTSGRANAHAAQCRAAYHRLG
ncbi:hypothetical protein [Streptomyces netropsis]|uniref:Uncharacterized protein n=1 Tax=Streptomyces netropsis TaxID=55404 RepID=A0A7W7LGE0_STRNE|nr:hypothetical protein [Streptomyces netropsis]MBB4889750.1 hypothetical protein [Streptomyces netropsis]GGR40854.1 hypothetical protein GCM10010219_52530 [Streptomyces netropsis]